MITDQNIGGLKPFAYTVMEHVGSGERTVARRENSDLDQQRTETSLSTERTVARREDGGKIGSQELQERRSDTFMTPMPGAEAPPAAKDSPAEGEDIPQCKLVFEEVWSVAQQCSSATGLSRAPPCARARVALPALPRPTCGVCRAVRRVGAARGLTGLSSPAGAEGERAAVGGRQAGRPRPKVRVFACFRARTRACVGAAQPARLRAEARAWFQGLGSELGEAVERRARLVPCTALGAALTVCCVVQAAKQPHDRDQDLCLSHQQDREQRVGL